MTLEYSGKIGGSTRPELMPPPGYFRESAEKSPHGRVLVVDDEALLRWSLNETLSAKGYEVAEAADGASAIAACSRPDPPADVVLLDLRLPDSQDLRVLSTLRRISPKLPIIVMTAFGTRDVAEDAMQLGAFRVLDKPFELNDIPPLVEWALATAAS